MRHSARWDRSRVTRLCLPIHLHLPDKSRNRKLGPVEPATETGLPHQSDDSAERDSQTPDYFSGTASIRLELGQRNWQFG